MSNAANVSYGKPKTGGAIYRAPLGTPLPTDAVSVLNSAFEGLGYCSEDGLTNTNTAETEDVNAWGGDRVMSLQTSKNDSFSFNLIEILNLAVLKAVYGDDNVSGNLTSGITVKANSKEQEECSWVIDMVLRGNILKRIVIPNGKVSEVGEIPYQDNSAIQYPTTLVCVPDASGNTHYEYMVKATTLSNPTVEAESADTVIFGTNVSDIQTGVNVASGAITGTLKYLSDSDNDIVKTWGAGNFIALKFSDIDAKATSVKVGLDPSAGSGLVEIIDDPDKNGVFKISDKSTQVFKVVTTDGANTKEATYSLSGLILEA